MTKRTTRTWINLSIVAAALAVMALGMTPLASSNAQDSVDVPPPMDAQSDQQRPRYGERPRMREQRDGSMRKPGGAFGREGGERSQGGRGGRPGGGEGGEGFMPSDEEIEKAMEVLRAYDAKIAEHADSLRESNPERYRMLVRRYMPQIRRLMYLKESQPETYELHLDEARLGAESERLSRELRENSGNADELRKQLRDAVAKHFDLRQQIKEQQLIRLEEAVEKLRDQLDERLKMKESLIDQRMEELTGKKSDRMW